jgi:hypothetical protein
VSRVKPVQNAKNCGRAGACSTPPAGRILQKRTDEIKKDRFSGFPKSQQILVDPWHRTDDRVILYKQVGVDSSMAVRADMRGPGEKPTVFFRLVVPATSVFVITVLALIAVLFGDERAPLAQALNRYGNTLLVLEFVAIIVLSILAMALDRRQILRDQRSQVASQTTNPGDSGSQVA